MAPSRQGDMARFAIRSLFAATIACFMTASIAGKWILKKREKKKRNKFCEKISAIFCLRFLTEHKGNRLAFGTDAFVVLIF